MFSSVDRVPPADLVNPAELWVSVEDFAAHLGVAKDSVCRRIDGDGLPAHKIGKLWKFKLSEVDAMDSCRESRRAT
jgi:excisionase family DNA binding protein